MESEMTVIIAFTTFCIVIMGIVLLIMFLFRKEVNSFRSEVKRDIKNLDDRLWAIEREKRK